ncbi:BTAD domain-containing putative transcriptional regulator [Streptomyces corynorhini]|uniref:AfsR/SARP family transcriptional regulator n=1 Tax=Streptomyces corynorhini TaxID=2282652 RepID=A0A370B9H0_9ACTN|nr:BTAD domain-containing putative transcriptional regulator [Streptomyces corynorhini]RDG37302.1 AfsR/SARP family transcriptional regulator [Streptomyces corynorhini]
MDGDARLRITLLGTFEASRGETAAPVPAPAPVPIPVPGARLQRLVVRLALAGGRPVGRHTLIDAIWPEDSPAGPAHALQALVSRLRGTFGGPDAVVRAAGGYRLDVDALDVDALRFEHLAEAGRERLRAHDPHAAAARLGEAMALWGGHPGAEPLVVAAVEPASATRLAQASLEAAVDLAEAELALGSAGEAAARLSGLLSEEPLHERAVALLMDALAAQGRQAEALARYARFRERLADALGTDPGAALRERHLTLLRAQRPEPSARTAPAETGRSPSNLPAPLTSFIGREDDLARIETLLASGRLVTVLGPGGAGKTRLALEAARHRRPAYRDGAWLVDLAPVTEPGKVGGAVLAAIGLRGSAFFEAPARRGEPSDDVDVLAGRLDGREILLVIDNCEHVIDIAAHLISALLPRCAGLRVLATSREPLAIDGEALVPLGPLSLPGPDAGVEEVRDAPSARLFTERAAATRPGFEVDEHNLVDVLRVVRGLDGLPLALELAAARLRTLSLTDLADGLSDRFALLTTGNRTASSRHRTLRGVIAWSWDLLDEDARTVAERVAVLPGGVTPASAAAVCAGTPVPARGIPELLAGLVDRSLLQLAPDTGRYRMLETIREYGLERLAAQNTLAGVRDLAAHRMAGLVAHHDPLTRGPRQLGALRTLRAEHDNVIAALRHLCDTGAADAAIALALDLTWYWQIRGRRDEAVHWLGRAVALPTEHPGVGHDIARAMLRLNSPLSRGALFDGLFPEGGQDPRALTDRLLGHRELPGVAGALITVELALPHGTEESEAHVRSVIDGPDVWLAGYARISRAHAAENRGDLDQARDDVSAALRCFTRAGDHWAVATALPLRSLLRQYDGELDDALDDLREAERLAGEFGALGPGDEIFIALRRFDLLVRLGRTAQATEIITATRERALRSASPELAMLLDARESRLSAQTGDLDRAARLIDAAEAGPRERSPHGGEHGRALIATVRGELCLKRADGPAAARALHHAYAAAVRSRDLPIVATVAVTVAGLAELYGHPHDAAVILGAAARLRGAHDPTDPHIRELRTRTRAALGDTEFSTAYASGRRLDVPAALTRVDPARVHG